MIGPITPCLWFDGQAREAADFYASVFPDAAKEADNGMTVSLRVAELELTLLNGGPEFKVDPSISFFYNCESEAQIDELWARLSEGGTVLMSLGSYPFAPRYGWVADRYGVNWQLILPSAAPRQKAFPSLMFTRAVCGRAEEAIAFYASVFGGSETGVVSRYGPNSEPDREGSLNYAEFSLAGQWFSAMDSAGPHEFGFSEGLSLATLCDSQDEIDRLWKALSAGGSEGRCGWLKDRFGLSWQVVPRVLGELLSDPERAPRVVAAFMPMGKLEIEALLRA
jgi:predicted 3-demethylubiquinone-9 3-methyltransferase (glyoxalase superfamily)